MHRLLIAAAAAAAVLVGCAPQQTKSPTQPPQPSVPRAAQPQDEPDDAVLEKVEITVINIDESGKRKEEKVPLETMHLSEWNVPFYSGEGDIFDDSVVFTSDSSGKDMISTLTYQTKATLEEYEAFYAEKLKGYSKETDGASTTFHGANEYDDPVTVRFVPGPEGGASEVVITKSEKKI